MTVGQEKLGQHNLELIQAMAAFGGGPARMGGPCGILSGAVAVVAMLYGRRTPADKIDNRLYELNQKLADRFAQLCEPYGGMDCFDIVAVDWRDQSQIEKFRERGDGRLQKCARLVGEMAFYLGELLDQNGIGRG
ncbi:MAG: C-GCAxxG-C-C family protein [Desulfarculaceae bacterium]|nr:C-GCAxxG-C-C family protein [Desulfarculaceae bacterium]MCF8073049.1 C-GCAxxG-C-C family protein [Desulfarculaceae bacterium]MCF8101866.1 C-GCAxxG-C-C family protein [Desulfarculaceae bacterium]MCF8115393.1 C-GCAxxG-C-C family protein [Desulfarculaceae bacterium]